MTVEKLPIPPTPNPNPSLVMLSYSCGKQSHRIARGLLRGEIPMPKKLLVLAADPGGEHKDTIRIRDRTLQEFRNRGIHAFVAPGPTMPETLEEHLRTKTRTDNAAYWTAPNGRLPQECTRYFKIRPMDRCLEAYLRFHMGWTTFPKNSVEKWIGFTDDERHRCKPMNVDYQQVRWPLIDMGETKQDVLDWYAKTGEEEPPPSVCNWCWANGTNTFKRIHETDPEGYERAIEFDEMSRDLRKFRIEKPCYCSKTLISLRELRDRNFEINSSDAESLSCDSGMCFI